MLGRERTVLVVGVATLARNLYVGSTQRETGLGVDFDPPNVREHSGVVTCCAVGGEATAVNVNVSTPASSRRHLGFVEQQVQMAASTVDIAVFACQRETHVAVVEL